MKRNVWRKGAGLLPLAVCVLCLCLLCACGGEEPVEEETPSPSLSPSQSQPQPEPSPEPAGPHNLLTGLPMDEERANARPVAVMLNNLREAMPQQGNSGADIIYEVVAEGGITRMLAVYQSVDGLGIIGSVRSARPYYIELALGHDAIFIHAGGSEDAYENLSSWNVDHMDGVRGYYSGSGLFWRDHTRVAGHSYALEHSLVTSDESIQSALAESEFRLEHEEGYEGALVFAGDGTPDGGETAGTITVPFSGYKTGVFRYDAQSGLYLAEEYGEAYIDGNSGEQIAVTNVLVLRAPVQNTGDYYGHMTVELSEGDGWFACGGKLVPITWKKGGRDAQITYCLEDGSPLTLGEGRSYINIIGQGDGITWE